MVGGGRILFYHENICCIYSLELPHLGNSNKYSHPGFQENAGFPVRNQFFMCWTEFDFKRTSKILSIITSQGKKQPLLPAYCSIIFSELWYLFHLSH